MKKLAIISAIAFSGLLYNTADAQFGIRVGIHLFPHRVEYVQTAVDQYANDADFYYLPDIGAYYSVDEQLYYYCDGQDWISSAYLPGVYHDYDWRDARRVEIREARPYLNNDFYRNRYQGFDNDLAHNHDHFREGFDARHYRNAYNAPQRFDNRDFDHHFDNGRGGNDQHFDNKVGNDQRFENQIGTGRFDNRSHDGFNRNNNGDRDNNRGGGQFYQNRNSNGGQANQDVMHVSDRHDNQGNVAFNDRGYHGH